MEQFASSMTPAYSQYFHRLSANIVSLYAPSIQYAQKGRWQEIKIFTAFIGAALLIRL
jgi:hypothetical protein